MAKTSSATAGRKATVKKATVQDQKRGVVLLEWEDENGGPHRDNLTVRGLEQTIDIFRDIDSDNARRNTEVAKFQLEAVQKALGSSPTTGTDSTASDGE